MLLLIRLVAVLLFMTGNAFQQSDHSKIRNDFDDLQRLDPNRFLHYNMSIQYSGLKREPKTFSWSSVQLQGYWHYIQALSAGHQFRGALENLMIYLKENRDILSSEELFQVNFAAFWIGIQQETWTGQVEEHSPFPIAEAKVQL
jgi:hypothetical protein